MNSPTLRLLITAPDQPGLIAAVSSFVHSHSGNIVEADQHTDQTARLFFMRLEIERESLAMAPEEFPGAFGPLARRLGMTWRLADGAHRPRVAVFAGPSTHCVSDLLWRFHTGELGGEVVGVVSNHDASEPFARALGLAFERLPSADEGGAGRAEQKRAQEGVARAWCVARGVELIVLARYMQILSPAFVGEHPGRIINIHHSFLPAFAGARPYHQAHERGVKLIGATAHYVTEDLDEGPIIAQQTASVSHRDDIDDMVRKGRDLERVVLAEAVRLHLEHRVITHGRKTVVFA